MSKQAFTPEAALALQQQIDERVQADRRKVESDAFPLGLFGVVSLIAAAIAATGHTTALGIYWSIAGIVGGSLIGWHSRRRELRFRLEGPPTAALIATAVSLALGATLLGWTGGAEPAFFAVGSGYVLFAALTGNPNTFRVAVAILACTWLSQIEAWSGAVGLSTTARTVILTTLVGIAQLTGAAVEHRRAHRSPAP